MNLNAAEIEALLKAVEVSNDRDAEWGETKENEGLTSAAKKLNRMLRSL